MYVQEGCGPRVDTQLRVQVREGTERNLEKTVRNIDERNRVEKEQIDGLIKLVQEGCDEKGRQGQ